MKKWNRLVAFLLIGATSGMVTGCIDYDEPKGIEAMRTAKAEFYSAQAALKNAEAKYKDAEAEIKLQELELKKIEVALATAKNDAEIAQIAPKLENVLLELKAAKTQKELAYQQAIQALNEGVWGINSSYRNKLSTILASIISNRESYNSQVENLVEIHLNLVNYTTKVDSVNIIYGHNTKINTSKEKIALLEKEKSLLLSLKEDNTATASSKMNELYSQITKGLADYNNNAAELAKVTEEYTAKENEINALKDSYESDRSLYNKDASVTFDVPSAIQHDFISKLKNYINSSSNDRVATLCDDDVINIERLGYSLISVENYEYYSLKESPFITKLLAANYSSISTSSNPILEMRDAMHTIIGNGLLNSWGTYAIANDDILKLDSDLALAKKVMENAKKEYNDNFTQYNAAKEKFTTSLNAMKIVGSSSTSTYPYNGQVRIDGEMSAYFNEVIDAINAYVSIASPTDDDKQALVNTLKQYGQIRETFDGFVSKNNLELDEKDYEKLDKDNLTVYVANQILGNNNWDTSKETSAYGNFTQLCDKLFGCGVGNVVVNPYDIETMFKLRKLMIGNTSVEGYFSSYFYAYVSYQQLVEKKAWVELEANVLTAMKPIEEAATAIDEVSFKRNNELKPLTDELYLLNVKKSALSKIGSEKAASLQVSKEGNLSIICKSSSGSLYSSLCRLCGYYNAYNTSSVAASSYITWISIINEAIANEQDVLFSQEQQLEFFKKGGHMDSGEYMKVMIEKCNSEEKKAKATMEKLDKELELLQKERDAILAVINGTTETTNE